MTRYRDSRYADIRRAKNALDARMLEALFEPDKQKRAAIFDDIGKLTAHLNVLMLPKLNELLDAAEALENAP